MCSYKLVTANFEVWGLQTRVEEFIQSVSNFFYLECKNDCVYVSLISYTYLYVTILRGRFLFQKSLLIIYFKNHLSDLDVLLNRYKRN